MTKIHGDVPEGDSRYLALELLNSAISEEIPDLKKSDVFSFGIMLYELIEGRRVSSNGQEWHDLRDGRVQFSCEEQRLPALKEIVIRMLDPNPMMRPNCDELLSFDPLMSREQRELNFYKTLFG